MAPTSKLPTLPRDFGHTADHGLLVESARRFFRQRCGAEHVRALYNGGPPDAELHRDIAALGWLDARALGYLGAALLCEEAGRVLCPTPIAVSIVAHDLLVHSSENALAVAVESGELIAHVEVDATDDVVGVHEAAQLLLVATEDASWHQLTRDDANIHMVREELVDATRAAHRVQLKGATTKPLATTLTPTQARARSMVLLAAESCGAADRALAITRDYARERHQFGRAIGTFQAVSHPIVNTLIAVEQARSLVLAAAAAIDSDASPEHQLTLARMAKAASSDALRDAASRGVQLHGGFGFTWDCDMHFYFRRSLHDHARLGSPRQHRAALAALLLAR